jgi:S-DNA-T family DNA segregation ATPase FtsK/SpoIIIE
VDALIERFARVRHVPVLLALPEVGSLGVAGPRAHSLTVAHGLLWQVAIHQAPSEVRVGLICSVERKADWAWLRWLPHTLPLNGDRRRRLIAMTDLQVEQLLIALLDELSRRRDRDERDVYLPRIVLLVDHEEALQERSILRELLRHGAAYGICVLALAPSWEQLPGECGATLAVDKVGKAGVAHASGPWSPPLTPITAAPDLSRALGRALTPLALTETGGSREVPRNVRLLELLRARCGGEFAPEKLWCEQLVDGWQRDVPLGRGEGGVIVGLDLRQLHDGPHGLIAGKTGAGKSELLQAIIAAITATHRPDQAQLLLVDYKGGAALRAFARLPHTVGLVTDLQDSRLAERAITAMKSELRRRKDLLHKRQAADILIYRGLEPAPEPLANLLIVIDEFDTMVKEQPGFVADLITVVKQGRSLGVHLLLASQEPATAVKEEIKSQIQFWIALRLGSAQDSRVMLERPDAFYLPSDAPGRAYKRVGTGHLLFQAPRVGAAYQPLSADDDGGIIEVDPDSGEVIAEALPRSEPEERRDGRIYTDLDFMIDQISRAGHGFHMHSIWCPPLPPRITLGQVLSEPRRAAALKLAQGTAVGLWAERRPPDGLVAPIGVQDIPQESRQESATINLDAGHVLVLGAPGSGKTTLLRTLLLSLTLSHSPASVWVYAIDAGGQGLNGLRDLPHLGGLVLVREAEQVRRVIWMLHRALEERERAQRTAEQLDDRGGSEPGEAPAIVLVIDKFSLFREAYEHDSLLDDLIALAAKGRAYGIHLVITADRPGDVPYRLQGLFEVRLVLRLAENGDALALTGKRSAGQIPVDLPGRGYILSADMGWLEFQVALPYVEEEAKAPESDALATLLDIEIAAKLRHWSERLRQAGTSLAAAQQAHPPAVRLLPERILFAEVWPHVAQRTSSPAPDHSALEVFVGLEAQNLGPASFILSESVASIFVAGGVQAGKTTVLRTMLRSLALAYSPEELTIALVDPRRSSFRNLDLGPHQPLYAASEEQLVTLGERLTHAIDDEAQVSRWVVCIDDYDVGQSQYTVQFQRPFSGQKTFAVVLERLVQLGRERGFSLIVAANTSNPTQFLGQLSANRAGLILQAHTFPPATNILGVRLPIPLSSRSAPPGRGLMVNGTAQQWVQVAVDEHAPALQ